MLQIPRTSYKIPALTGFRCFAAFIVFMHHYTALLYPKERAHEIHFIWQQAGIGVGFFFVLSGFLITALYRNSFHDSLKGFKFYIVKRFARIYPLYFLLLLIATISHIVNSGVMDWNLRFLVTVLLHVSLVQSYFDAIKFSLNPTAWTISIEEAFYLFAPMLFLVLGNARRNSAQRVISRQSLVLLVAVVFCLFVASLLQEYAPKPLGFFNSFAHWSCYTIFGRSIQFAAGIFLGVCCLDSTKVLPMLGRRAAANAFSLAALFLWVVLSYLQQRSPGIGSLEFFVLDSLHSITAICFLLALCGSSLLAKLFSLRAVVIGGEISYALYLLQLLPPVRASAISLASSLSNSIGFQILLCYLYVSAIAVLLHYLFEKPIQKSIVSRYRRKAQQHALPHQATSDNAERT